MTDEPAPSPGAPREATGTPSPFPAAEPFRIAYATPGAVRHGSLAAVLSGIGLVLVGALVLVNGIAATATAVPGRLDNDTVVGCIFAVCVFSGICLLTGLPLIFRGLRGPLQ